MSRKRIGYDPDSGRRGVSDVIAFTFVFSIIITSVGLVSAVGFTSLNDLQASEQAVNAQRAFETIGANFEDIQRGAPGRTGEIQLNRGTLYMREVADETEEMRVAIDGSSAFTGTNTPVTLGTVYYSLGERDTTIAYEGGAVFREDRGDAVMISEPQFICNDERAMVTIVQIAPAETADLGSGTVQIEGRAQTRSLVEAETGAGDHDLEISMDSAGEDADRTRYLDAWRQYFNDHDGWSDVSGDSFTTTCTADKVYVRHVEISVDFLT